MSLKLHALPSLFAITLMTATPDALAQQAPSLRRDRSQPRERVDERVSMSDTVRRAERTSRGEVLSAERVQYDGRDMHRVKVVDDQGRVRVYMQDPSRNQGPPPKPARDDD